MVGLTDTLRAVAGPKTAAALAEHLDIDTVADLLQRYPRRYYRRGELTELASLREGDYATVMARVVNVSQHRFQPRNSSKPGVRTEVHVTDGRATLRLVFFHQPWLANKLHPGRVALFSGKVQRFRRAPELVHPQVQLLGSADDPDAVDAWVRELLPVYPATAQVSSATIAKTVDTVLGQLDPVPDPLPSPLRQRRELVDLDQALRSIHQPQDHTDVGVARRRLAYDEAFVLQAVLAQRRRRAEALSSVTRPGALGGILDRFDSTLPYELTRGQRTVGGQLAEDLGRDRPMHRLLQGDVGSGKTVVALRAMLQVVDSGGQAVLLAPTEVLAQQHHASIRTLLGPLAEGGMLGAADGATRVVLLTGSASAAERRAALAAVASGEAGIVVGTHALLQPSVSYHDLGLIVVDEQHRFGVEQRSALLERIPGMRPHLLVMTATPIPRTVAMTVFGDLDVSTLTERPTGVSRTVTHVVAQHQQPALVHRAWARVAEEVAAGRQVFVVCTRIDESDEPGTADAGPANFEPELFDTPAAKPHAVTTLARDLAAGPLSSVRVGVMHGRLAPADKDDVMRRFAAGPAAPDGLDVLVSTTVIEVGVDIPHASTMVIMDADRFGVSQLHQLRGRVGRAGQDALCLLVTQSPPDSPAHVRLQAIAATNDGFALARLDLEQRREGDVLGEAQSGARSSLRLLSVLRDEDLIVMAREDATALVEDDADLDRHPGLRAAVQAVEEADRADYLEKA